MNEWSQDRNIKDSIRDRTQRVTFTMLQMTAFHLLFAGGVFFISALVLTLTKETSNIIFGGTCLSVFFWFLLAVSTIYGCASVRFIKPPKAAPYKSEWITFVISEKSIDAFNLFVLQMNHWLGIPTIVDPSAGPAGAPGPQGPQAEESKYGIPADAAVAVTPQKPFNTEHMLSRMTLYHNALRCFHSVGLILLYAVLYCCPSQIPLYFFWSCGYYTIDVCFNIVLWKPLFLLHHVIVLFAMGVYGLDPVYQAMFWWTSTVFEVSNLPMWIVYHLDKIKFFETRSARVLTSVLSTQCIIYAVIRLWQDLYK
jgi:hypothetical protein